MSAGAAWTIERAYGSSVEHSQLLHREDSEEPGCSSDDASVKYDDLVTTREEGYKRASAGCTMDDLIALAAEGSMTKPDQGGQEPTLPEGLNAVALRRGDAFLCTHELKEIP